MPILSHWNSKDSQHGQKRDVKNSSLNIDHSSMKIDICDLYIYIYNIAIVIVDLVHEHS